MIYRLSSKFTQMSFFAEPASLPDGLMPHTSASEFAYRFEEIALASECKKFRLFKAPILPEWRLNCPLRIEIRHINADAPEFIVWQSGIYVSERVKEIIEQVDSFSHQFWPVPVSITKKKKVVESGLKYFRMNIRRYISIEESENTLQKVDFNPVPSNGEIHAVAAIQNDINMRRDIETLPLWRLVWKTPEGACLIADTSVFINSRLFNALTEVGVVGINEYTKYLGRDRENVAHV